MATPMVDAGAATVDITPPPGAYMDGYGNRREPSQGVHDQLFARVLVLDYGHGDSCAFVGCDLLGMHPEISAAIREQASSRCGISPDAVLISATHNHAGPVGLRAGMFSRLDERLAQATTERIGDALALAWESRQAVTLKTANTTIGTISANRRDPALPIDAQVGVLLLDSAKGPLACLLNVACHGTVLTGANLLLSAEFPGVACRIIEQATGARAVYLNGACGDVNPAWIEQDFASVERLGQIIGGQAVRTIAEMRAADSGQRTHNIRWDEFPEVPAPGRLVEPWLRFARREIDLPLRQFLADQEYADRIDAAREEVARFPGGSAERRQAMSQLSRYEAERWAAVWARQSAAAGALRTEVQALSLGEGVAVVGLPGEFFAETGRVIRDGASIEQLLIACYANDYVGYVVPEHAYDEGGYESGITALAPGAEHIITGQAIDLLRQVSGNGV